MIHKRILNFFIIFIFSFSIFSQHFQEELKFKHYTSTDGLSQRSVMSILQDNKGYLWFGTRDGLNKFDGIQFKIYRHFSQDTTTLSNNNVHTIFQDSFQNLWIGTQNGLNKLNASNETFKHYKTSNSNIADNIIWGITEINNYLYVATNNGLSILNIKTDEIKNYKTETDNTNSLSNNSLRSFLIANDGNLWISNIYYIDIFNPINQTFKRLDYPKPTSEKILINDRPTLFQDSQNKIWLGYNNGLAFYNKSTKTFQDFTINNKKEINTSVRSICEDLLGNLWIGTYSGLYILDVEKSSFKYITNQENKPNSLSQNSIYKIIKDSRGDIWIGTWAAGINYYNKDNQSFKEISFGKSTTTLNYRVVSGIVEDNQENLWIGTEGGGLNYYNRKSKTFTFFKQNPNEKNTLSGNNIKAVIIDKKNTLWIGIHDGGVNYVELNKKPYQFKSIDFNSNSDYTLKDLKVLSLLEDRNGNIWIGTLSGGIICYNTKTKTLHKLDDDIRTIMCIVQTENPEIILIGGDNGLESVNINTFKKNKIEFIPKNNLETELPYVNTIFIDNFNNYWIGTEGQGLHKFNAKRNEYRKYNINNGLLSDIIYGILSDNNGNLWISTNYGISRINIQSNIIKNFTYSDGLQGNEFNYGSYFKTSNQELFFGGTNGLTYFNPSDIQKNNFVPQIDIHNLDVNNSPFLKITDSINKITLKHNQNNFSIDFSGLSFMQPEKNNFAYKLEGYDTDWIYGSQRRATYTNIPQGQYTFIVKASNNNDVWNTEGDTILIEIKPPLWLTWWAYLIYTILVVGITVYIRSLLITRFRQKKELLKERQEREKTEEMNQLKLNLFTDVSHEFRTPLTLIIGPLERMISQGLGDDYIQEQHKIMNKNAKILLQLINQILDFRKNESGKLRLQASKSNIVPFIKEVKESFKALADEKKINYQLTASKKNIEVWFDKTKLNKILFNLISNAFKFTKDNNDLNINIYTTTRVENQKNIDFVAIEIVNFVSVIPESHIKLIFERFYQLDHKNMNVGSGIGLSLTKSLVELHKGFIQVESSSEEGTRFTVFLRLGKEHLSEEDILNDIDTVESQNFIEQISFLEPFKENTLKNSSEYNKSLESILIVEDNKDVQLFIKNIFINTYNVFLADDGFQGFTIASNNPIDLIISDVNMPEMTGFELCNKIKTTLITSHIPVILLTAKTAEIHQEEGFRLGANAYITKPFKASILETRVHNLLSTRANLIRKFNNDIVLKPEELTITSTDELFLQKAIKIVEENITNPDFNTSNFIDLMGMSRTVLYTKLKAITGQNLSTFIRIIKLKKAGQLLL